MNSKIQTLPPFTKFISTIGQLPASYLVSMTYEEQLLWLCNYLENTVIPTLNNNGEVVEEVQTLFIELKSFVDNYFENLDVQEEINNKLDEMATDGTLEEIITQYLNSQAIFGFNNVSSMKLATNLIDGSYAKTLGYNTINDGGGALYKIREITSGDVIDEGALISLNNNLVGELIENIIYPEMFGNNSDSSIFINKAINYCISHNKKLMFNKKIYEIQNSITINNEINIDFNYATIKAMNNMNGIIEVKPSDTSYRIENINIKNCNINSNKLANYGLYCQDFGKSFINNFNIINSINTEMYLTSINKNSNENTIENIKMARKNINEITEDIEETIALYVDIQDSYINNVVSSNYKYHIINNKGVNWFFQCHGWNDPTATNLFDNSYFIQPIANAKCVNCNSSGTQYVIYVTTGTYILFNDSESILTSSNCEVIHVVGNVFPKIYINNNYFYANNGNCNFSNFSNVHENNNRLLNVINNYKYEYTFNNINSESSNKLSSYLTLPNGYYKLEFMSQGAISNNYSAYTCLITNADVNYNSYNVLEQGTNEQAPRLTQSSVIKTNSSSTNTNVLMKVTRFNPFD